MHSQDQPWVDYKKSRVGMVTLFFAANRDSLRRRIEGFLLRGERVYPSFSNATPERGVYFLEGDKAVLKHNKPLRWSVRLRNGLRIKRSGKNCLADEFSNLKRLAFSDLVPEVYGYARRGALGFLFEEALIVEYFDKSRTLDELLRSDAGQAELILPRVFDLFSRMLDQGFLHLDPHPNNIIISSSGELRLIDFEGCSFQVSDRQFCLAFCVGRLYRFWFEQFLCESAYDIAVSKFLIAEGISDPKFFMAMYRLFKDRKISRKECYQVFSKEKVREIFVLNGLLQYGSNNFS